MPGFLVDESRKLTPEDRARISEALGPMAPEANAEALTQIEHEMQRYLGWAKAQATTTITPAQVNAGLKKIEQEASRLSRFIEALPLESTEWLEFWFLDYQAQFQKGLTPRKYVTLREAAELLWMLSQSANQSKLVGRPPDHALHWYLIRLQGIFEDFSERKLSRTWDRNAELGKEEGGIAREYFSACLEAAGYKGYPRGMVKKLLRSKRMDQSPPSIPET